MSKDKFIDAKLKLISGDNQPEFGKLVDPLSKLSESGQRVTKVPIDGNWFKIEFEVVDHQKDRLVISARRIRDGLLERPMDPSAVSYRVEFEGTRAAYIRGFYECRHGRPSFPYISWDIRAYANHPVTSQRVYVRGFHAREEIRRLIVTMESVCGTTDILNRYINDNLSRFRLGIQQGKTPEQVEREWSRNLMESLGYRHVEAVEDGPLKGKYVDFKVHWFKDARHAIS